MPARSSASPRCKRKFGKERFGRAVDDYYFTNPVARASAVMANLSALHSGSGDKATGTDG